MDERDGSEMEMEKRNGSEIIDGLDPESVSQRLTALPQLLRIAAETTPKYPTLNAHDGH